MRANLIERARLYRDLLPWDDPNYGLDESWVRCDPYEQHGRPGGEVRLEVVVAVHSEAPREAVCRPVLPIEWGIQLESRAACGAAKSELRVPFEWITPSDALPGRTVVPIEVTFGGRRLGQFREAIVVVQQEEAG